MKREWYCWNCGDKLGDEFYLWSLNDRIDRVFMVCSKDFCFRVVKHSDSGKHQPIVLKVKTG